MVLLYVNPRFLFNFSALTDVYSSSTFLELTKIMHSFGLLLRWYIYSHICVVDCQCNRTQCTCITHIYAFSEESDLTYRKHALANLEIRSSRNLN